ncbi:MAG: exosortase C-terminal domain/associated protein EpsI [Bryobacteraceae bacterium]|jgi:EpsI family protein
MDTETQPPVSRAGNKYLRIATLVLVAQAVLFYTASHGDSTPLNSPLIAFPAHFGDWRMFREGVVDKETQDILRADDTLTREYSNPGGAVVNLFIAWFKTQRYGQSPHSPKNCLPGSGWQKVEEGVIDVPVEGETIRINRYLVSKGENESIVLYWYQSQGQVIADEFAAKFNLITNSIRKHRSDTALVRVVIPTTAGRHETSDVIGRDFVKSAYPVIKGYLPQ